MKLIVASLILYYISIVLIIIVINCQLALQLDHQVATVNRAATCHSSILLVSDLAPSER